MTYTINDMDYEFFPATVGEVSVICVSYTRNGESFCEWSDEAWMPRSEKEAEALLRNLVWEIVDSVAEFQNMKQPSRYEVCPYDGVLYTDKAVYATNDYDKALAYADYHMEEYQHGLAVVDNYAKQVVYTFTTKKGDE